MSTIPVNHDREYWESNIWDWPLQNNDGVVDVISTKQKFEVSLSVQYFKPNEIEVKVADNELLINFRHETRGDKFGSVTREIHRAYKLPHDVNAATLKSHLSSKGMLTIIAEKQH